MSSNPARCLLLFGRDNRRRPRDRQRRQIPFELIQRARKHRFGLGVRIEIECLPGRQEPANPRFFIEHVPQDAAAHQLARCESAADSAPSGRRHREPRNPRMPSTGMSRTRTKSGTRAAVEISARCSGISCPSYYVRRVAGDLPPMVLCSPNKEALRSGCREIGCQKHRHCGNRHSVGLRVLLAVNVRARRGRDARDRAAAALRGRGHSVIVADTRKAGDLERAIAAQRGRTTLRQSGAVTAPSFRRSADCARPASRC